MAFTKSVIVPGGYAANYFVINQLHCTEDQQDAKFVLKVFKDQATADAGVEPGLEVGTVRFTGAAFDLFFSKAAIVAANINAYAGAYLAIAAMTAAKKARNAWNADTANPKTAPALTANQQVLASALVTVSLDPRYGGELFYDGATNV